ncbi:MAG: hypothetical protein KF871_12725 [Hydrogenophaga sp.]|uniref:hypothetical protein n=1 Tax=Hydrogenophaga sp. TaxID=1904254 RepID=UPI001DBFC8B5|nr:hypothetical protein [Hydrogenophaga sp.]MBX3610751.1 hypothetical protein [Hydrogenophaga sp.]
MTLSEYFAEFQKAVDLDERYPMTSQVAAELAAGHSIGLSIDQMRAFLARRTAISSVAVALVSHTLSPEQIARIDMARTGGAVLPKDVIATDFSPEEIRPDMQSKVFGEGRQRSA